MVWDGRDKEGMFLGVRRLFLGKEECTSGERGCRPSQGSVKKFFAYFISYV